MTKGFLSSGKTAIHPRAAAEAFLSDKQQTDVAEKKDTLLSQHTKAAETRSRQVTVLVTPSLHARSVAFAKRTGIKSFNNFVNYALERVLMQEDK